MFGRRNKTKSVLEEFFFLLFLYLSYKIIEQEMNKMVIHRLPVLFSDLVTPYSLY